MIKNVELKNDIYHLGGITLQKLIEINWMTKKIWGYISKGNGELIEQLTLDYFKEQVGYTNIKKTKAGEFWDFELTNDPTCKVDIRRCGQDELNLGYTSGGLANKPWQEKAEKLENGGYLCVEFRGENMHLFYVSAKYLLDSKFECGNKPSLTSLKNRFSKISVDI